MKPNGNLDESPLAWGTSDKFVDLDVRRERRLTERRGVRVGNREQVRGFS
jgi:hypothetical protein